MKIDSIVKALIVASSVFSMAPALAWTVGNTVVEGAIEERHTKTEPVLKETQKTLALPDPQAKFEKHETLLSAEEQGALDFREALSFKEKGEYIQAERLLRTVLLEMPMYHLARMELASLYLKRDQLGEAELLLGEGLRLDENNPDFLRLMAMVYDRQEKPDEALALLVKVKDSRKHDKNYVALLGHIYQQTGRFALARQQYYRLLQEEPDNPLWLLGVSVALDSEGQKEAALEGYRKITLQGGVDPTVLEYVKERIAALKG